MSTPSFLPQGLELVDRGEVVITVPIGFADSKGKQFRARVQNLTMDEFRALNRQKDSKQRGFRPGSDAEERHQRAFNKRFLKKVVEGWEDLTGENFDALNKGAVKIGGDDETRQKFYAESGTIDFSDAALEYLADNTRWEDFGGVIWDGAYKVAEAEEAEQEEKKAD